MKVNLNPEPRQQNVAVTSFLPRTLVQFAPQSRGLDRHSSMPHPARLDKQVDVDVRARRVIEPARGRRPLQQDVTNASLTERAAACLGKEIDLDLPGDILKIRHFGSLGPAMPDECRSIGNLASVLVRAHCHPDGRGATEERTLDISRSGDVVVRRRPFPYRPQALSLVQQAKKITLPVSTAPAPTGDEGLVMNSRVTARTEGVVVRDVGVETVVYNLATEQVTALDPETAAVYRAAGDGASIDDLGSATSLSREKVAAALVRLADADLLLSSSLSRRQLLSRVGTVAAIGTVVTIAAPTAAMAASATKNASFNQTGCSNKSVSFFVSISGYGNNKTSTYKIHAGSQTGTVLANGSVTTGSAGTGSSVSNTLTTTAGPGATQTAFIEISTTSGQTTTTEFYQFSIIGC